MRKDVPRPEVAGYRSNLLYSLDLNVRLGLQNSAPLADRMNSLLRYG
jgi:hypothetical protein